LPPRYGEGTIPPGVNGSETAIPPSSPGDTPVSPAALSWLGAVRGMRVSPLGVDRFGQTGDLIDLHRSYRLDADAIVDAAAELFLD
jgi:hypothetical protein